MLRCSPIILTISFAIVKCILGQTIIYDDRFNASNEVAEKSSISWLQSAQNMMSSPAGHVVVQMAKELLNRSAGNSQVLSLNLSNLLVIVLLKILIFSAGMLGAGHWSGYGYGYSRGGRSYNNIIDDYSNVKFGLQDGEGYLITGFLAAQGSGIDDCLEAAACTSPRLAYEYAKAARALLDAIDKFEKERTRDPRYIDLINLVETAAYNGYRGSPCNMTLKCDGLL